MDTDLGTLIGQVEGVIAAYCGYPVASAGTVASMGATAYTRYYTGGGDRDLFLDVWPATTITSVYDDPTLDFTSSSYLVSSNDYSLIKEGRVLRLKSTATHGAWSTTEDAIRVVFTAGYSTAPASLKVAIIEMVKELWDAPQTNGRTSINEGGVNIGLIDERNLSPRVKTMLDSFVLPRKYLGS
jgi:hypothetical protein